MPCERNFLTNNAFAVFKNYKFFKLHGCSVNALRPFISFVFNQSAFVKSKLTEAA